MRRFKAWLLIAGVVVAATQLAGCGKDKGGVAGADAVKPPAAGERVASGSPAGQATPEPAAGGARLGDAAGAEGAPRAGDNSKGAGKVDGTTEGKAKALDGRKTYDAPPPMKIDPRKRYFATLKTTKGDIKIELFAAESPKTVNNFVFLAREHFYDGVRFHRIIGDFMVQTGDPNGDGTGGPGYSFEDELPPRHSYEKGIVAMANAGPDTNGSQFFICSGPACKMLDMQPNYSQFGRVVAGMDVLDKIASTPVESAGPPFFEMSKPKEDVRIESMVIEEK